MADSIFSKIIRREITAHFVYEDDICVVIMDKFPSVEGQTLVIPRQEIDYIFELEEEIYAHLFKVARLVGKATDLALKPKRTCLAVEGFEVPHVHIKIYPVEYISRGLGPYLKSGEMMDDIKLAKLAEEIKAHLK